MEATEKLIDALDKRKYAVGVFIDFKKHIFIFHVSKPLKLIFSDNTYVLFWKLIQSIH